MGAVTVWLLVSVGYYQRISNNIAMVPHQVVERFPTKEDCAKVRGEIEMISKTPILWCIQAKIVR